MEPVYLTRVSFKDVQAFEDVEFEFTDGLNIIVGDNSYGKSIFMKMLRITAFPNLSDKDDRHDFIRYGKSKAEIHYWFSDQTDAIVEIYDNQVIYRMRDVSSSEFYVTSNEPFGRLLSNLSFIMDIDSGFIANVMNGAKDLFFVDSNAQVNERLQRAACTSEELESLKAIVSERISEYTERERTSRDLYFRYQLEQASFTYKDVRQDEIMLEIYSDIMGVLNVVLEVEANMRLMSDYTGKLEYCIDDLLYGLGVIEKINQIDGLVDTSHFEANELAYAGMSNVFDLFENINAVKTVSEVDYDSLLYYLDVSTELTKLIGGLTETKDVSDLLDAVELKVSLNSLVNYIGQLSSNQFTIDNSQKEITLLEEAINSYQGKVNCPVYGEVFIIDGQCVHDNNRPA